MPHTSLPVWDSQKSAIAKPILLLEGRSWRIVDEESITYRADGGREIFAEQLASRSVRTPVYDSQTPPEIKKALDRNGKEKTVYALRTMKAARRKSEPPTMFGGGESLRLTPGRPTAGDIASSSYGRLLDNFAAGDKKARRLFRARRTPRNRGCVSQELQMQTAERALLYFPFEGMTSGIREKYRRRRREAAAAAVGQDADASQVSSSN